MAICTAKADREKKLLGLQARQTRVLSDFAKLLPGGSLNSAIEM